MTEEQIRPITPAETFAEAVDAAIVLKQRLIENLSTDDGDYRAAFYKFYNRFMSLYYMTKSDVINGRTLNGLEDAEKRQELINRLEQYDEDVMTGKLDVADARTGISLLRQYTDYLKYYNLV
ncbi:hypothetical protein [Methanocella arvoryzae]|uniref:Uncharacterized protein n=1 Tax=Methanocella arvoryzae (strain DSM 22066 / NBRC 105507 / MRE50) TaxID=351160 RepID=Q0W3F9_METAR|nr:hypothetical protein [Methanocella arvoryzae]CAJ37084.1 hypothetical protein RCIX1915 [Methanocella arvoryzae MRE50]